MGYNLGMPPDSPVRPTHLRDPLQYIQGLPSSTQVAISPGQAGAFITFQIEQPASRVELLVGRIPKLRRYVALHRYEPFWMIPAVGSRLEKLPAETQWLLCELEGGECLMLAPLLDPPARASLKGAPNGYLKLTAESGAPKSKFSTVTGLYLIAGKNPEDLAAVGSREVCARLDGCRLRQAGSAPDFIDRFGWCTWDAFYQGVSHENVRQGLESFAAGGVTPRFVILDDGWQSERQLPSGERRLTAFQANSKFPGGLAETVRMAKEEYDVERFLVWHAVGGYWGGVDGEALPGYGVTDAARHYAPEILEAQPHVQTNWGTQAGLVPPQQIYRFYQDYHRYLRSQGVDGVKVDNQASLEGLGAGHGGRLALAQAYREAMQGSAAVHFDGRLINCMSLSNDLLYNNRTSQLTRTSVDFWPQITTSHGLHLWTNALMGLWFGQFLHPDWDMFQSGHPAGAFHAAGRALSGGPVYVSDQPELHDFGLLRKLVLPDGSILRALEPGRITRDCLFEDPILGDGLLKIVNRNRHSTVVGVFNCHTPESGQETGGHVTSEDAGWLWGQTNVIYAHMSGELWRIPPKMPWTWPVRLKPFGFEIFTVAASQHPPDVAVVPIGLADLFNSGGAVLEIDATRLPERFECTIRGSGRLLLWSAQPPAHVEVNDSVARFSYQAGTGALELEVPAGGSSARISMDFRPAISPDRS